jgi:hypothetical protein
MEESPAAVGSAAAPPVRWDRPGAEVAEPPVFTLPEQRTDPAPWDPYYGLRFGRRTRVALTAVLLGPATVMILLGLLMLAVEDGPRRAGAFLLFVLVTPSMPLVLWIYRDLWLPRR